MNKSRLFKLTLLVVAWGWLLVFGMMPLLMMFALSFTSHSDTQFFSNHLTLSHYAQLMNLNYARIFFRSLWLAGYVTVICLILGYPFAYIIAQSKPSLKKILLILVIIPFWTSSLIRSYAIITIIKANGILNHILLSLGIIHFPLQMLYTNGAVIFGLVYNLLPFMILPLVTSIERLDLNLVDAARDLGANWLTVFRRVIIPQTRAGIISGCIMVLFPAMTLFYIPNVLGGARSMLLGNFIQDQFLFANDWQKGSAASVILCALVLIMGIAYWQTTTDKDKQALL